MMIRTLEHDAEQQARKKTITRKERGRSCSLLWRYYGAGHELMHI